jgi:hypothetical protein
MCGAGARPVPPIQADLAAMGRKGATSPPHDGLLDCHTRRADRLTPAATGFGCNPSAVVHRGRPGGVSLARSTVWPGLHESSRQPRTCVRSVSPGHFDIHPTGTQLVYNRSRRRPRRLFDLGILWAWLWLLGQESSGRRAAIHHRLIAGAVCPGVAGTASPTLTVVLRTQRSLTSTDPVARYSKKPSSCGLATIRPRGARAVDVARINQP